ncbi:MAG: tetrapyrrole methylase family protein/MazG family protein [Pseudobdellovibrio sp.]|jgi:tetrapyrrole methylase family protein/MazG family protein|nr:tetrapyrrole methylase family protein/MazG family protein [Pseudobdellovibrio sp.]
MPQPPKTLNEFDSLVQVLRDLRGPGGCPWDQEQTHLTLTPYLIEEVYEAVEALESEVDQDICEELGDVLFQVVLHAQLANERNAFNISDVIEGIVSKIVRRHPHVFSDTKVGSSEEVLRNWEEIKRQEKKGKPQKPKTFSVPVELPALQSAGKIGEKTKKYKFDWNEASQVLAQLKSEIAELEEAMQDRSPEREAKLKHEMGDVLFSAAQVARHLEVEPETSLRAANTRFTQRFESMLELCGGLEKFISLDSSEKELLWKKVKEI